MSKRTPNKTEQKINREIDNAVAFRDHDRARRIVRLAADQVKNPSTKSWLWEDEIGSWERQALEYLAKTADKARELGMSSELVDDEIANRLGFLALKASLEHAEKRTKRK
jgi:hypothetical protein